MKSLFRKVIPIILVVATIASTALFGSASEVETQSQFASNVAAAKTDAYWAITDYQRPDASGNATLTVSMQMKNDVDDDPQVVTLSVLTQGSASVDGYTAKMYPADETTKEQLSNTAVHTMNPSLIPVGVITSFDDYFATIGADSVISMPAEGLNYFSLAPATTKLMTAYTRIVIVITFTGCGEDFNPAIGVAPVHKSKPNSYSLAGNNNSDEGYTLQTRWLSAPQANTVTYTLSDSGKANATLPFSSASITKGQAIGTANIPVPIITAADAANGWKLKGYYIGTTKYATAADLAAVVITSDTSVVVNVFQDKNGNDINDADEVKVIYALRKGYNGTDDKGTLSFTEKILDKTALTSLGPANIPEVTFTAEEMAAGWSFDKDNGFFIDGIKYTYLQLSQLALDKAEINIEVRTKLDSDHNGEDDRDQTYKVDIFNNDGTLLDTYEIPYDKQVTVNNEDGNPLANVTDKDGKPISNPFTVTEDGSVKLPVPPTKPGYEFAGWDIEQDKDGNVTIKPTYSLPGSILDDKYSNELIVKLDYCEAFTIKGLDNDGTSYNAKDNILSIRFAPNAQQPTYKLNPTFNFASLLKDKTQTLTWEISEVRTAMTADDSIISIKGMDVTVMGSMAYKCVGKNSIGQSVTLYLIVPGDAKPDHLITASDYRQILLASIEGGVDTKLNEAIYDVNNDLIISASDYRAVLIASIQGK